MMDDDDECGAVSEMRIGMGNRSIRKKTCPNGASMIPHAWILL
jgi:hypothetical protein